MEQGGSNQKGGLKFAQLKRKIPMLKPALELNHGSLLSPLQQPVGRRDCQVTSIKRAADRRR